MSKLVFEHNNGERSEMTADAPISEMIAQAKEQFGEITVMQQLEEITSDHTPQEIHVLEVAQHNIQTALDQLSTVETDVSDATKHVSFASTLLDKTLGKLRG